MNRLLLRAPAATWAILVAATLFSFLIWRDTGWGNGHLAGSVALVIAFFKVRLIGLRFMELDTAPWPLRLLFGVWIAVVGSTLFMLYWQA
jgi:hypothetical protein